MRLLTPSEQREIEQLKTFIIKGYGNNDIGGWTNVPNYGERFMIDVENNQELWLNILDMVLNANEAMQVAWRQSFHPNLDLLEIVNRLSSD